MKKLLVLMLVLGLTSAASAVTVSLYQPGASEPGGSANELDELDTLRVYIVVDGMGLDTLACTVQVVSGDGDITGGLQQADAPDYGAEVTKNPEGWGGAETFDGGWQTDFTGSVLDSASKIRIGAGHSGSTIYGASDSPPVDPENLPTHEGTSANTYITPVAYVDIQCTGPTDLVLSIINGAGALGSTSVETDLTTVPTFGGDITIHQVPEPMTIALLGLGGLLLRRRRK
jgi:hypothetical protein